MNKVVKETRYCKVLRQAKIRDNNVAYGIEKIFVKELNQEEIRFVYFKDTVKGRTISSKTIRPTRRWFDKTNESINKTKCILKRVCM